MPPDPSRLTIRSQSRPGELDLFRRLSYVLDHEQADDLATGRRVPEWMWVALDGDRVVARAAWWTNAPGGEPLVLDFFDLDDTLPVPERVAIGVRLLETATTAVLPAGAERPEYGRFVPPDWHEDPVVRDAVEARIRVMEETGARMPVERLRLEWRAGTPVPEDSGRHGYIDDLLAEGTRVPAAEGVDRIRAATDLGNVPMAKSFERAFTMVRDAEKSKARG
ncbi:hypothetical protein [Streptomyces badius]|uniref:Uncharacterized protein n=1 Tax=Streptomyces badius TaxID=1941 RepID=A0ABQ2T1I4_STRBA|nr:hypothetical protein [Streptomyces badius]GGS48400.1 hypothetical protein GCM10010253_23460 [Streptomyces badius]